MAGMGFGSGSRPAEADSSAARCTAVPYSDRSWAARSSPTRRTAPAPSATASPSVAARVTRIRTGPRARASLPCSASDAIVPEAVPPAPDGRNRGTAERRVDLASQVSDVDLHHVGVELREVVPHVAEE